MSSGLELARAAKRLAALGLMPGTTGNLSIRSHVGMLVTPSGMNWDLMEPQDLIEMSLEGERRRGLRTPTTEWRLHGELYRARPELEAIVHTHSRFATIISCLRETIPAIHYMIALTGGPVIPCARYETYGTQELAVSCVESLGGGKATLLANHGQVSASTSLEDAVKVAIEVENLAFTWWHARSTGNAVILDDAEIARVAKQFQSYGQGKRRLGSA